MKCGICDGLTFDLVGYRKLGHTGQVSARERRELDRDGARRSRVRIGRHDLVSLGNELGPDGVNGIVEGVRNRILACGLLLAWISLIGIT